MTSMWLVFAGFLAGILDSIVGGGGLITLPALLLEVGPGAHAIGSNKIPGFVAAFTALLVYARKGHIEWRRGVVFSVAIALGAFLGSKASPLLPARAFKLLLSATAPLILSLVFFGGKLRPPGALKSVGAPKGHWPEILSGVGVGFYDGAWGPGGGTFMFLALLWVVRLELLPAMATAKLANSVSALFSGVGYWSVGLVRPFEGASVAVGAVLGAVIGARLATRQSQTVARPALVVVALLLLWRVWSMG